ncbi:MAG TPA: thiolase family protein [Dehalococcoidia bacterium]|nr:thiolase family protein [Dehalococcoidia bacterium]
MEGRELRGKAAITGLGITEMGRIYGHDAQHFAAEAIARAVADAGLRKDQVDGLLVNPGVSPLGAMGGVGLQNYLGLTNLRLLSSMNVGGATANIMVQYAALAVTHGLADHVACIFADAPLRQPGTGGGAAYAAMGRSVRPQGMGGLYTTYGVFGVNAHYALAARRHMAMYGTTTDQLGAIAVAERAWAAKNPIAEHREPITLDDYRASRWIVEPLRLLDCCLVSNGGVAVIVSRAEEARDLAQPPVYILGMGQGHPGDLRRRGWDVETQTGAPIAKERAFAMAGITLEDVDVLQAYDCYTYTVLVTLEDYGFCAKGEGGPFVADGKLGPGGSLPTNTGGGQLSAYYMWGMTPLSEGIIQARGQGGERQVAKHDVVLVTGNGGILDHHSTLVLSGER